MAFCMYPFYREENGDQEICLKFCLQTSNFIYFISHYLSFPNLKGKNKKKLAFKEREIGKYIIHIDSSKKKFQIA